MELAQLGLTTAVTIIGSGIGTTIVGLIFKRRFDQELELQKAYLARASQVHMRQVDTVMRLYRHFREAQVALQLMASSARFAGERPEEYPGQLAAAVMAAKEELFTGRLLLPPALAERCEKFFEVLFSGRLELDYAADPHLYEGAERAEVWKKAKAIAHEQVPMLLSEIESVARDLIHGEPAQAG